LTSAWAWAGKAEFLIKALGMRGIALSAEQTERISGCTDQEQLEQWLSRVFEATSAEDVFAG